MGDQKAAAISAPTEDNIHVVCRFRPLNDSEEKSGSSIVVTFPSGDDNSCSLSVIHSSPARRGSVL